MPRLSLKSKRDSRAVLHKRCPPKGSPVMDPAAPFRPQQVGKAALPRAINAEENTLNAYGVQG